MAHLDVLVICIGGCGDARLVPTLCPSHTLVQHIETVDVQRHLVLYGPTHS